VHRQPQIVDAARSALLRSDSGKNGLLRNAFLGFFCRISATVLPFELRLRYNEKKATEPQVSPTRGSP
jgi:hypothetical protein